MNGMQSITLGDRIFIYLLIRIFTITVALFFGFIVYGLTNSFIGNALIVAFGCAMALWLLMEFDLHWRDFGHSGFIAWGKIFRELPFWVAGATCGMLVYNSTFPLGVTSTLVGLAAVTLFKLSDR